MYVLCLLRFKDDKIVFKKEELSTIGGKIYEYLRKGGLSTDKKENEGWHIYNLCFRQLYSEGSIIATITSAQLGYYHHRVMAKYKLRLVGGYSELREVRRKLKCITDCIIESCVKGKMNELASNGEINRNGEVIFFYTYPFIIRYDSRKSRNFPFSEQTGTLCFEIVKPRLILPFGERYLVWISIPATTLRYQEGILGRSFRKLIYLLSCYKIRKEIETNLRRDMINAIYQHCLYEKKLADIRGGTFENSIDENLLVNLWTHILDKMGGKTADIHDIRIAHISYFMALLALLFSIFALLLTSNGL